MTVKDFKIRCPMCKGTIVVDARSGKIIRHREQSEKADDNDAPDPALFDDALGKVHKFKKEGESQLDDAFTKVSKRRKGLDKLFDGARKKAKDEKDDEDSEDE